MTTITIHPIPAETPLKNRAFASGRRDQWCIDMNEDGDVNLVENSYGGGYGGATPADVWHRRTLQWGFNDAGDGTTICRETLSADLAVGGRLYELLETVYLGHDVVWNNNNYVGKLTDEAREAHGEIAEILADYPTR